MKTYIILTGTIRGVGGSIIYTRNKVNFLKTLGYRPIVFHACSTPGIYVSDLLIYEDNFIKELAIPTNVYSLKEKEEVLNKIISIIGCCDSDIIIESQTINTSLWGELLAEKLNVRHIVYLLYENYSFLDSTFISFFKFKYDRNELVGISGKSIPNLLSNYYDDIEPRYLIAHCVNVVEDILCPYKYQIKEEDVFCIGLLGRMDKNYVLPTIKRLTKFFKEHLDLKFKVLCIGGVNDCESDAIEKILKEFKCLDNVDCLVTGLIYPIPYSMIIQMDLFISSAGSALVSYSLGVPTISIDALSFEAIGILGYTTNETLYADSSSEIFSMEKYIDDVLKGKYVKNIKEYKENKYDFSSHIKFIENCSCEKMYFDINALKLSKSSIKFFVAKFFGYNTYYKLKLKVKKIGEILRNMFV